MLRGSVNEIDLFLGLPQLFYSEYIQRELTDRRAELRK
jgi:hypothetical protein